jgi:hypothetical protein
MLEADSWPKSVTGWLLSLTIGPMAFLLLILVGEFLADSFRRFPLIRSARNQVLDVSSDSSFSGLRIAYLFSESLLFIALIVVVILAIAWATQ